jgi:hypothetical protein
MERTRHDTLQREFIYHVLKKTVRSPGTKAYLYRMHMWIGSLEPYLDNEGRRILDNATFTIFDELYFIPNGNGDDEEVYVALSPEAAALFRAWLRRRGLDPMHCSS